MLRGFLMLAAFFGFTGVALGALAAQGLKKRQTPEYQAILHTRVTNQFVHTQALLGVALLATQIQGRLVAWAGVSFAAGILLFSGSLYVLTMTGISKLGIITPFGGLAFLAGWVCLGLAAWRLQPTA